LNLFKEQGRTAEELKKQRLAYHRVYEGDLENSAVLVGQSIGAIA